MCGIVGRIPPLHMFTMGTTITQNEFIKRECAVWGEDFIFDLIERGYETVLTDHGWKWILPKKSQEPGLAFSPTSCYTGSVGAD